MAAAMDFLAERRRRRDAEDEDDEIEEDASSEEEEEDDDDDQQGRDRVRRVLWERQDPFTYYNDVDFHRLFRFNKENLMTIVELIRADLDFASKRSSPLNAVQQVCLTLSFFASGSFQHLSGYLAGVKKTTACMTIRRVSRALVAKADKLVAMPTKAEMRTSSEKLFEKFKIPNCPLGIDGTHIRLGKAPSPLELPEGTVPQDFWCRKQYWSLNGLVRM
jgi:hypothetical protein